MITPWPHQAKAAEQALAIIKEHMIVYLAMEERTGKTLTSLIVAETLAVQNILIITKKKALKGWEETLAQYGDKNYTLVNYHRAKNITGKFDLIILDESHNYISGYPKPGQLWKDVKRLTRDTPLIYISATPYAQGPQMLFHQFALSSWSPWWPYKTFYNWFMVYGKPYTIPINGINIQQYDRCKTEKVLGECEKLFITQTREDIGFKYEPVDKVHYMELSDYTKDLYNELLTHELAEVKPGVMLVCDSSPKLRTSLHQIEGGTVKIEDVRVELPNKEKIDFMLKEFGDNESLVIMYNYIAEKVKLEKYFKKALILQATSFAEGVDLSEYKDLVIYSQDFSTARHTQRRARQCNMGRKYPIVVHYLLVKKAVSAQVYKTVSINKSNFVDRVFSRTKI